MSSYPHFFLPFFYFFLSAPGVDERVAQRGAAGTTARPAPIEHLKGKKISALRAG
jgi:hypothetical protein